MHSKTHPSAQAAREAAAGPSADLGPLPEWNLGDLYESRQAPAFAADLERAGTEARAFADAYRGRIAAIAAGP